MSELDKVISSEGELQITNVGTTVVGYVEIAAMPTNVVVNIKKSVSPQDRDCQSAFYRISKFAESCAAVLYSTGSTVDEVLSNLEFRAKVWNSLDYDRRIKLMRDFAVAME